MRDETYFGRRQYRTPSDIERLNALATRELKLKMIYMWVKQNHITPSKFIKLLDAIGE